MNYKNTPYLKKVDYGIICALSLFRIWLGVLIGVWFDPIMMHDDALMINYADLPAHFNGLNVEKHLLLVKEMMYPLFLDFVHAIGLNYTFVFSTLWLVVSLIMLKLFSYLTNNRKYLLFVFTFVLFSPVAFDSWTGTRIYRNSIIAPFVAIVFALILIIIFKMIRDKKLKGRKYIITTSILGIVFFFTAYIKEDGIWLVVCLLFSTLVWFTILIVKYLKHKEKYTWGSLVKMIAVLCLPLVIYVGCTNFYKLVNYHYFGIYETNTRTSGELGEFVKNVYKINSDDRTSEIWAPADAIEKTFEVSKTLQKNPQLLDHIIHTPWFSGNIYENPIHGDFLSWVLRDALVQSDLWQSETQVAQLFHKVNSEIESAFHSGKLKKDKKIQLVSSAGGRSLSEILDLRKDMWTQYKITVFLDEYEPGSVLMKTKVKKISNKASFICNTNLEPVSKYVIQFRTKEITAANKMIEIIFKVYRFIQPVLCIFAIIGFFLSLIQTVQCLYTKKDRIDKEMITVLLIITVIGGISLAYTLSIGWFSSFLNSALWLKYYTVGLVPMVTLIELFGTYLFLRVLKNIILQKK